MKIVDGLLCIALAGLLITAGCISGKTNQGTVPSTQKGISPVFPNASTIAPVATTLQESYADKIIGTWKTESNNSRVLYWQFNENWTFTGGSEPGGQELTGNWSQFTFKNAFEIKGISTNSTVLQKTFDIFIGYDISNKTVSVIYPAEYSNWKFIKQP